VISFLAAGNVAQRLTLEILTQKLDLFGKVLDASDEVLYSPSPKSSESLVASVGVDFENELRVIYGRARSLDDVTADLQHLRETIEARRREFDEIQDRASGLIETRLDDAVKQVLANYQSALPSELEGLDRDVELITRAYFDGAGIAYAREQQAGRVAYRVQPSPALPVGYREGFVAIVGDSRDLGEGEALHVGHAIVQAAVEAARLSTAGSMSVIFEASADSPFEVRELAGRSGRLAAMLVLHRGIERVDNLLVTAILDGELDPLPAGMLTALLALAVRAGETPTSLDASAMDEAIDAAILDDQAVFLHPEQRQLVTRDYSGPARVAGSAGTGKTVVALHRAVHLARTMPDGRILVATFSEPLAHALRANVKRLIGNEPRLLERIEVHAMGTLGLRLHHARIGPVRLASSEDISTLLRQAAKAAGDHKFSPVFLRTEWDHVVDAWQLATWEAYRNVPRLGRRTRLPEARRAVLWAIFEQVRAGLKTHGLMTESGVFEALADAQVNRPPAFDAAVVDEAQDVSIAQLRFLAALGGSRPNALFFAGDLGQRIFQQPFSWKELGVDVRGRSQRLRVNYRTSHQIREQAARPSSSRSACAALATRGEDFGQA
jgi:hypothetical protein